MQPWLRPVRAALLPLLLASAAPLASGRLTGRAGSEVDFGDDDDLNGATPWYSGGVPPVAPSGGGGDIVLPPPPPPLPPLVLAPSPVPPPPPVPQTIAPPPVAPELAPPPVPPKSGPPPVLTKLEPPAVPTKVAPPLVPLKPGPPPAPAPPTLAPPAVPPAFGPASVVPAAATKAGTPALPRTQASPSPPPQFSARFPAPSPATRAAPPSPLRVPSPSPLPAPSPVPAVEAPKVGSLVHQARARLRKDHRSLANVSRELIQVQTDVANTEQVLFGKILDLQAVRTLYSQHMEVEAANAKLREEIKRLTAQVEGLSSQVATAQRGYINARQTHRQQEDRLRARVIEDKATVESLKFEVARGKDLETIHSRLCGERWQLLNESARISREGEAALRELSNVTSIVKEQQANITKIEVTIARVRQDEAICHQKENKEEKELNTEKASFPKEFAAAKATEQHAKAAARAGVQRLLAEGAILRDQVKRAEASGGLVLAAMKEAQAELQNLEATIIAEVRQISDRMNATRERTKVVKQSLDENRGVQEEDLARKNGTQQRLSQLQEMISPAKEAALRAENEAYQSELLQELDMLRRSKNAEAIAAAAVQQMQAEVVAQRQAASEAEAAIQQARDEGQKELQKAVDEANAGKAKSAALIQQAEAAVQDKCQAAWDARQKAKDKLLQVCKSQRSELAVAKAQRDTLEQTIKARQTANEMGGTSK